MTPEEAIRFLGLIYDDRAENGMDDSFPGQKALKLGIEALKRVKSYKEAHIGLHYTPMPGETEK